MNNLFVILLLGTLYFLGFRADCMMEAEEEADISECSGACYKSIKLLLEYIPVMQKRYELCEAANQTDIVKRLERIENQRQRMQSTRDFQHLVDSLAGLATKLEDLVASQQKMLTSREAACKECERNLKDMFPMVENYYKDKGFKRIGRKFYYISQTEQLDWLGASRKCLQNGSYLISLQNEAEYLAVISHLHPGRQYWTDINDRRTEGIFLSRTGKNPNFINWRFSPDNAGNTEDCVELGSEGMNDNNCQKSLHFICELTFVAGIL